MGPNYTQGFLPGGSGRCSPRSDGHRGMGTDVPGGHKWWAQMSQVGTEGWAQRDVHRCPRWAQMSQTDTKGWVEISQMDTKGGRVEATEPLAPLPSPRLFNLDLFFKHQHLILRCGPRPPLIPNPPVVCGNIYSAFTSSSSPDFTGTSQFPITHIQ